MGQNKEKMRSFTSVVVLVVGGPRMNLDDLIFYFEVSEHDLDTVSPLATTCWFILTRADGGGLVP